MIKVYVAGKYSDDTVLKVLNNIRKGINASRMLFTEGFAPFCPWFDFLYGITMSDEESLALRVEQYYEYSLAWLEVADCVFLLPERTENSVGVQGELTRARELGIPIFTDINELKNYMGKRRNIVDDKQSIDIPPYIYRCNLCNEFVDVSDPTHYKTCKGLKSGK